MKKLGGFLRVDVSSIVLFGALIAPISAFAAVPTLTLSASPTSVTSGSTSKLTWKSTYATSCAASGAWSGPTGLSGTFTTKALTANSSFTLKCTGSGGSVTRTVSVTVTGTTSTAPTLTFS